MPDAAGDRSAAELRGEGFMLRRWRSNDLEALLRHANDAEVERGLSDRFPHPYTRADGEAFLAGRVVDLRNPVFAIEVDGEACGGIGARPLDDERRIGAALGYWIGRRHWGHGLMTRVVGMFAPWAMEELHLERLQATVLDFNTASARVLEKNGFVEEGLLRRAVVKHGRAHDLRLFARIRQQKPGYEACRSDVSRELVFGIATRMQELATDGAPTVSLRHSAGGVTALASLPNPPSASAARKANTV